MQPAQGHLYVKIGPLLSTFGILSSGFEMSNYPLPVWWIFRLKAEHTAANTLPQRLQPTGLSNTGAN